MTAQRAVTLLGITVESDVLGQEMLECLQQRAIPMRGFQNGSKHAFKTAILVARDAQSLAQIVHGARSNQIRLTNDHQTAPSALLDGRQRKCPAHELVMIHLLPARRYPRPRREVVGVALTMIKLQQLLIIRI